MSWKSELFQLVFVPQDKLCMPHFQENHQNGRGQNPIHLFLPSFPNTWGSPESHIGTAPAGPPVEPTCFCTCCVEGMAPRPRLPAVSFIEAIPPLLLVPLSVCGFVARGTKLLGKLLFSLWRCGAAEVIPWTGWWKNWWGFGCIGTATFVDASTWPPTNGIPGLGTLSPARSIGFKPVTRLTCSSTILTWKVE